MGTAKKGVTLIPVWVSSTSPKLRAPVCSIRFLEITSVATAESLSRRSPREPVTTMPFLLSKSLNRSTSSDGTSSLFPSSGTGVVCVVVPVFCGLGSVVFVSAGTVTGVGVWSTV